MSDALDLLLRRAVDAGVLPQDARRPEADMRPWPVVLLTALGAWLAAVPLLIVVGVLLDDMLTRGIGPYLVGPLMLAGAAVLLRDRAVPLFVEQLAVPALLVGGGSLGFGLFRDLPDRGAALVLALIALGIAIPLARAWLRTLLGAAAAGLVFVAVMPREIEYDDARWIAVHILLALWLGVLWLQHAALQRGGFARWAALLESFAAGWLLVLLATLAMLSGPAFLVGGGVDLFSIGRASAPADYAMFGLSLALGLVAVAFLQRGWPTLREPLHVAVLLVPAGLAAFLPLLGAALLALALTVTTQRLLQAGAAAVAAAWIVGSFYYRLDWTLAHKAALLMAAGAVLGGLAWLAQARASAPAVAPVPAATAGRARTALIALAAVATLAVVNVAIWQKETLIAHGRPLYVELAPVDPRSLMQGDFMRLNFRMPPEVTRTLDVRPLRARPQVVVRRDARGVAHLTGLYREGMRLAEDELRVELTPKNGHWVFVTDAWFFREGDGARWQAARYGEFRVDADGRALLVGMADANLQPIVPQPD